MSSQSEPMMMGSPQSPQNLSHNPAFLPAYLLGDVVSPQPKWSSPIASHSTPAKPRANTSWMSPPNQTPSRSMYDSPRGREGMSARGKDKPGAPPVSGLLEHITSPTSDHRSLGANSFHDSMHSHSIINHGGPSDSTLGSFMSESSHKRGTISPPQVDPFFTQGVDLGPEDDLDETWVTVFGFPPSAASFILQQFSQYGTILHHKVASCGNWMHLHYQSKIQAKKALSKNGKVLADSIMVGVSQCIDKSVMAESMSQDPNLTPLPAAGTPTHTSRLAFNQSALDRSNVMDRSGRGTPMRPLTAAHKAARHDTDVVPANSTPQKNDGLISKAMEYMFGW